MTFGDIIKELKDGKTVHRSSWWFDKFIVRQIPQTISSDIVPKMTSLPDMAKKHIEQNANDSAKTGGGSISYHDQVIQVNIDLIDGNCRATYYIPTWEDIFAEDWEVVVPS